MPGIIIHTILGTQILDRWRAAGAPFPVDDPNSRAMFLAGCMGPDMGMFPGGEPLFSNLAHYVRSGQLSRTLIQSAKSDAERAFAWGWATHVVADVLIHPLINIAAGDARGCGPLTYADDPGLHLSVEIGADGFNFARWKELALPSLVTPVGVAGHVAGAYRTVYGDTLGEGQVRNSLAAWFRWRRFSLSLAGHASAKLYGRPAGHHGLQGISRRLVKFWTGLFNRQSLLHALTHPQAPSARALSLIEGAIAEYPERFRALERAGLASLPDYNLDTGEVEDVVTYPLTKSTLAQLKG
jgi:hypothetical protein